jgi:hypothetical protein
MEHRGFERLWLFVSGHNAALTVGYSGASTNFRSAFARSIFFRAFFLERVTLGVYILSLRAIVNIK